MNKNAVAMAADSAVTLGNHLAVHNSQQKLFQLSNAPVGMITYDSAALMGVPKAIIINEYSKYLDGKTFPTLQEYADDFCSFIGNNSQYFQFDQFEQRYIFDIYKTVVGWFLSDLEKQAKKNGLNPKQPQPGFSWNGVCDLAFSGVMSRIDNGYQKIDGDFATSARNKHYDFLESIIAKDEKIRCLAPEQKQKLCYSTFKLLNANFYLRPTGIAISGYGEKDIFPSRKHFVIDGVFDNKVRIPFQDTDVFISEQRPSSITTYAQREIMDNILFGMDRDERSRLEKMPKVVRAYLNSDKASDFFNPEKKDDAISKICDFVYYGTSSIIDSKRSQSDIRDSIVYLPPQELALLAESMINITSILRKVKMDDYNATVGGPVDVAVISKSDGFTWVKKKKPFDI